MTLAPIGPRLARLVPSLDSAGWPTPVAGRVVLVTGGAGSIGQAVCRRCLAAGAARVVLVDLDENGLYLAVRRFAAEWGGARVAVEIASVREPSRVAALFARHAPTLVVHAAAHKQLPLLELAPCEAVRNNVLATATVCAAARAMAADLVLVSTDKAVTPTSVLGATKRLAERIAFDFDPPFHVARTGNVLGSAGSVVPLFAEQIARGGPLTLSHPEATRYFTRVEDAAALVVAAAAADHGPLLVTLPAPLAIRALAEAMIADAGRPIPIETVGLRPGEKLHETLLAPAEAASAVSLAPGLVRAAAPRATTTPDLSAGLAQLTAAAGAEADGAVLTLLRALVPDYAPGEASATGWPSTRP